MTQTESFVVGIDLGTTNFAISVIQGGRPYMVEDSQQNRTFPSAVFRKNGQWIVGYAAKTARLKEPQLGAYAVKRLMGLRYDSDERPQLEQALGLEIVRLEDGLCGIKLGDELFTPTDIAAQILHFSFELVRQRFGDEPEEVVITVPAYFNHAQRKATKSAAVRAGLPCQRIINEPTAAAVAYGMRVSNQSKVVVYDLGGGTFDISILQFASGIVETLAISGDSFLGGEDFDNRLVLHCLEYIEDRHGVNLRDNLVALRRLKEACETAKCELSYQQSAMIMLPQLHPGVDVQIQLTRIQLQTLTQPLVERSIEIVKQALRDAELDVSDIDKVILVGGQTRMPLVRQAISKFFNQEPSKGVHPDEVVAKGAALHASSLLGEVDAPMLFDVTPFNLGIDVQAGLFQNIITKNARIPVFASERFVLKQGKRSVTIVVRQGHSRFSVENEFLGEFRVANLELRNDGLAELDIAFRLDGNGMLHVSATDMVSGRSVEMKMRNYGEFIRADEEFEDFSNSEKAQIGVGDSSSSKANRTLDVQIRQNDSGTTVNDKTMQSAKEMRDLFAPSIQLGRPTMELDEQIEELDELMGASDLEEETATVSVQLGAGWDTPSPQVVGGLIEIVEESPFDLDDESESEELFVLAGAMVEEADDFVLGAGTEEPEPVIGGNLEAATDALDKLLGTTESHDFLLPQDDFFAGLTVAVTGQSLQDVLNQSIVLDENASEDVQSLSPEMRLILEELFQEL